MVMVSHKHKFIFLKTYKTAGTSIEMYLEPFCAPPGRVVSEATAALVTEYGVVGQRLQSGQQTAQPRKSAGFSWHNHNSAKAVKRELGNEIWRGYTKLTTVRNPFDRMVSSYHWRNRKEDISDARPFEETKALFRAYVLSEKTPDDAPIVHIKERFIIDDAVRYESIMEDLTRLAAKLGFDPAITALPLTKDTSGLRNGHPYWHYYDDDLIVNSVRKQQAWVFEHYDYPSTPEPLTETPVRASAG